ncbi:hypothetical protein A2690_02910 [Candidatus Roizmanbacteria bacterium RIFCSPHIGHO2_01_FULL_39_12b]|uniref:Sortase n=1 Tax=Candidatus Roizmanbacteria bacterium RIFCSPHIGHO2_01_FULL_39_12b TaxID=1802030 RepID=A0A1F7G7Z2_9BACT|nr:MAG: hypothetical protein A2690_02910 [Candidatus Roizmanbacteria bacterium RIFCSPHIGHO2_01_FULL_39_12b]OGK45932.1 MAG: hypothetical protein A3B46_02725 [Candidatus Roizmanbacteria bacterium RIFCSPLOWO2_01_FULL_39_19]
MAKKTPKKGKQKHQVLLLVICGLLLVLLGLGYRIHLNRSLSFNGNYSVKSSHSVNTAPKQIIIKSLEISLPIKQTIIKNGVWEVFNEGASHLSTSGYPDENKPIIVYAHNRNNQFGKIDGLKKGDQIILSDGLNHYLYLVSRQKVVEPSNTQALKESRGEILILYTCTGFADSKRLLVYANRIE